MKRRQPLRSKKPLKQGSEIRRRKPLPRTNRARSKKRRAEQEGPQAAICRELPCCHCGREPSDYLQVVPHHWPTRGAGGRDEHTTPWCVECHVPIFHDTYGSAEECERRSGVNVVLVAAELAQQIREAS